VLTQNPLTESLHYVGCSEEFPVATFRFSLGFLPSSSQVRPQMQPFERLTVSFRDACSQNDTLELKPR
jgi:hypothetical protein